MLNCKGSTCSEQQQSAGWACEIVAAFFADWLSAQQKTISDTSQPGQQDTQRGGDSECQLHSLPLSPRPLPSCAALRQHRSSHRRMYSHAAGALCRCPRALSRCISWCAATALSARLSARMSGWCNESSCKSARRREAQQRFSSGSEAEAVQVGGCSADRLRAVRAASLIAIATTTDGCKCRSSNLLTAACRRRMQSRELTAR